MLTQKPWWQVTAGGISVCLLNMTQSFSCINTKGPGNKDHGNYGNQDSHGTQEGHCRHITRF